MTWGIRRKSIMDKRGEILYEISDARRESIKFRALPKRIFGRKVWESSI